MGCKTRSNTKWGISPVIPGFESRRGQHIRNSLSQVTLRMTLPRLGERDEPDPILVTPQGQAHMHPPSQHSIPGRQEVLLRHEPAKQEKRRQLNPGKSEGPHVAPSVSREQDPDSVRVEPVHEPPPHSYSVIDLEREADSSHVVE